MFENNLSDPNGWSLGKINNLREVFGDSVCTWLIPIKSSIGDGLSFPTRNPGGDIPDFTNVALHESNSVPGALIKGTPSRTLVNPMVGGRITVTETSDCMVKLEQNGHSTKTVMLDQTD